MSSITLQIGAQVMLLRNLELTSNDRMLVNGSRGVITKFVPKDVSPDFDLRIWVVTCQFGSKHVSCEFGSKHMSCEFVSLDVNPDFVLKDERCEIVAKDVCLQKCNL